MTAVVRGIGMMVLVAFTAAMGPIRVYLVSLPTVLQLVGRL